MSLATLSSRKSGNDVIEKARLTLHDLHLDFCKQEAKLNNSHSLWNSALLNGYLEPPSNISLLKVCALNPLLVAGLAAPPWWSDRIPQDSYIHANLARHLSLCGRGPELAALLLDTRWLKVRGKLGGILGLKADFAVLDKLLQPFESDGADEDHSRGVRKSFHFDFEGHGALLGEGFLRWTGSIPIFKMCGASVER